MAGHRAQGDEAGEPIDPEHCIDVRCTSHGVARQMGDLI